MHTKKKSMQTQVQTSTMITNQLTRPKTIRKQLLHQPLRINLTYVQTSSQASATRVHTLHTASERTWFTNWSRLSSSCLEQSRTLLVIWDSGHLVWPTRSWQKCSSTTALCPASKAATLSSYTSDSSFSWVRPSVCLCAWTYSSALFTLYVCTG